MRAAYLLLVVANLVYATSYTATRLVLDDIPPALLGLVRLVVGGAIVVAVARIVEPTAAAPGRADARRMAWMGICGFAAPFAFGNWGLTDSTATNAALLIIVEPVAIIALGPALLGEALTRREAAGAGLALLGAIVVVVNGIPGVTHGVAPHWRGDLLLVLSGLAYASYTLLGRAVLLRHSALAVTARSIVWGAIAMAPLAAIEWLAGARPSLDVRGVGGALYLAIVITALGYLVWNWGLGRIGAPRAAIFITLQPIAGAVLGVLLLHEPLTAFTLAGGVLIVSGLWLTVTGRR
ncbi:MAG: DMT family transporter [Candidatus Rokuibacteriota bacterium]|nr:MAG: DMT family transporter [Candidatus Rokubacteria bacterium]